MPDGAKKTRRKWLPPRVYAAAAAAKLLRLYARQMQQRFFLQNAVSKCYVRTYSMTANFLLGDCGYNFAGKNIPGFNDKSALLHGFLVEGQTTNRSLVSWPFHSSLYFWKPFTLFFSVFDLVGQIVQLLWRIYLRQSNISKRVKLYKGRPCKFKSSLFRSQIS